MTERTKAYFLGLSVGLAAGVFIMVWLRAVFGEDISKIKKERNNLKDVLERLFKSFDAMVSQGAFLDLKLQVRAALLGEVKNAPCRQCQRLKEEVAQAEALRWEALNALHQAREELVAVLRNNASKQQD